MLFVLGFCVALLLVLMFGRSLWSIIGHWSGWRAERKIPAVIRDLEAERDSLKAEKALMAKRLESNTSDIKMRMAEQMAEVARNRNRVLDLTANLEVAQGEISKLREEAKLKLEQIAALKTQIEENVLSINSAWQRASDQESQISILKTAADKLRGEIAERDQRINNLENEAKALREIVTMFVPSTEDVQRAKSVRTATTRNEFKEAFMPEPVPPSLSSSGIVPPYRPLESADPASLAFAEPTNDVPVSNLRAGEDAVARSASNVLSLAERFRGLQGNMKRN
jgi:hypothetical protein